jgi:hypothetical protein
MRVQEYVFPEARQCQSFSRPLLLSFSLLSFSLTASRKEKIITK